LIVFKKKYHNLNSTKFNYHNLNSTKFNNHNLNSTLEEIIVLFQL